MCCKAVLHGVGVLLVVAVTAAADVKPANEYFDLCSWDDPDINECVRQSILKAKPQLVKGIPEMDFPPIDPFPLKEMVMEQNHGRLRLYLAFLDSKVLGLKEFNLTDYNIQRSNGTSVKMVFRFTLPWMVMQGSYKIRGLVLFLPIHGQGNFFVNATQMSAVATLTGHLVPGDRGDVLQLTDWAWKLLVKTGKLHFGNLFNGNKFLEDNMNRFLNANFKEAFSTYIHLPEQALGEIFRDTVNRMLRLHPWEDLLLPGKHLDS